MGQMAVCCQNLTLGALSIFEVSHPRCVDQLFIQKIYGRNTTIYTYIYMYILSHRLVHTTTCFGPVYWPSSGCIINLISSYAIYAWVLWRDEISS